MSYQTERAAIEAYFTAQWGATTPWGRDGQKFEPVFNSVIMTITSGAVMQGSIGRVANRIDHLGLVTFQVFTEGGKGSATWRGYAETLFGLFFDKTLDSAGLVITQTEDAFIRFSPPGMNDNRHPYVSAKVADPPFHITNVVCPFVRYETR